MTGMGSIRWGMARAGRRAGVPRSSTAAAAVALLLLASSSAPVWAARVVDVRVGKHAEFTRVVFELDRPTGYRIERRSLDSGKAELLILLDARAESRKLKAGRTLVEGVEVKPEGQRSIGRVRLLDGDLRLKEMILANPPRIVLDVLSPTPRRVSAATESTEAQSGMAPTTDATRRTASGSSKTRDAQVSVSAVERPTPSRITDEPALRRAAPPTAAASPPRATRTPGVDAAGGEQRLGGPAPAQQASGAQRVAAGEALTNRPFPRPRPGAKPVPDAAPIRRAQPAPAQRAVAGSAAPIQPEPGPEAEEGGTFDATTIGLAAVGLVMALGAFVIVRRRRGGEELEEAALAEGALDDDNPFAGLGASGLDAAGSEQRTDTVAVSGQSDSETPATQPLPFESDTQPEIPTNPIDPAMSGGGASMDATSDHTATRILDPAMPGPMERETESIPAFGATPAADGDAGGTQMMRDFERRLLALEGRLEEVLESRERLEKQVAAQTEELRVQRAAIARTQRAVRNMNRPEDDTPTEPALRDPNRPGGERAET